MSDYRIIYPKDEGGISIITPATGIPQERVLRDVPIGKPYRIVSVEDIPTDRTFRSAWEYNFEEEIPSVETELPAENSGE